MSDRPFIESIKIENLLSFPPGSPEIKLERLNVLIGPNGSGKSNLVDVIGLLRDAPTDMLRRMRLEGGWRNWAWNRGNRNDLPSLELVANPIPTWPIHWGFTISQFITEIIVTDEYLEPHPQSEAPRYYYREDRKNQIIQIWNMNNEPQERLLSESDPRQSILAQLRDFFTYPALSILGQTLSQIAIYCKLPIQRPGTLRQPQPTDLPSSFLDSQGNNLNLVLNKIYKPPTRQIINKYIGELFPEARGLRFDVGGNTIQLFLEEGDEGREIPATRLSDGTMQYLCLLAILCHPDPPPLICLEEPEVGLHPDLINTLGRLLVEASERTQLIVTTHSESLVASMSEYPQYVVVCENRGQGTEMRRLDPERLAGWLERYTLGDLWAKGEIGGNRW